ncbi:hypothetical protein THAOC_00515, partial [Thalassiosira oceanica]
KLRGYDAASSSVDDCTAGFVCSIGAADAAEGNGGRSDSSSPVALSPDVDSSGRGAEIMPLGERTGEKAADVATRAQMMIVSNVLIADSIMVPGRRCLPLPLSLGAFQSNFNLQFYVDT